MGENLTPVHATRKPGFITFRVDDKGRLCAFLGHSAKQIDIRTVHPRDLRELTEMWHGLMVNGSWTTSL